MGTYLLYILFGLAVVSFAAYLFGPDDRENKAGRISAWAMAVVSGLATLILLSYFTKGAYHYRYVYENSSMDLPFLYKVSGLWAGQEGTFLLWLFLTALFGVLAARRAGNLEKGMMLFVTIVEMVLVVLLIRKNPFDIVPGMPTDGMGLNPLLKNPWMAIHPPVVFIGYALTTIPFGLSIAGVLKKDFTGWTATARPWILASWGILGAGIALGSYWAYEVLGWGGYWGWDPVENASLLPWFTLGALVHGVLLQRRRGGFELWNIALAQGSFLLVIFGTFLTRSGVLSNFSVHSFQGLELYMTLLMCLIGFLAIGVGTVTLAASHLRNAKPRENRPFAQTLLVWTVFLLLMFCLFVLLGTTSPILTAWFLPQPAPVNAGFYNGISFVLGIVLAVLLALCPSYFIRVSGGSPVRIAVYAAVGVLIALAGALLGIHRGDSFHVKLAGAMVLPRVVILPLLVIGGAALAANVHSLITAAGRKNWSAASYLTHAGMALMIVAIAYSTAGSRTDRVVVSAHEPAEWRGYTMKLGKIEFGQDVARVLLKVSGHGTNFTAPLKFVSAETNRREVNSPYIYKTLGHDLYFIPSQIGTTGAEMPHASGGPTVTLTKGAAQEIDGYKVTFKAFDLAKMQEGVVGIVMDVEKDGKKKEVVGEYGSRGQNRVEGEVTIGDSTMRITGIDATSKAVELSGPGEEKAHPAAEPGGYLVAVELMYKPMMASLWLGMILIAAGTLLALKNRAGSKSAEQKTT